MGTYWFICAEDMSQRCYSSTCILTFFCFLFQGNRLWLSKCTMQSCSCTWKPNIWFSCWYHQSNPYSPCFYCSSMWRSGRTSASWYKDPGVDVTGKSIHYLFPSLYKCHSPDWWCKGFRFSTHSRVLKCQKSNPKDILE